jgi:hypothetical protein
MGVPGGMNGTADALVAAVRDLPPSVTSWSATGIGRSTLAVMYASLSKGGHLRVGMEDVLTIARGVPVDSNAQLVERAVDVGPRAQRTPMTTTEARGSSASGGSGRLNPGIRGTVTTHGCARPRPGPTIRPWVDTSAGLAVLALLSGLVAHAATDGTVYNECIDSPARACPAGQRADLGTAQTRPARQRHDHRQTPTDGDSGPPRSGRTPQRCA